MEFAEDRHIAIEGQLGCLPDGAIALDSNLTQRTPDRIKTGNQPRGWGSFEIELDRSAEEAAIRIF
jgi:hypothetical protein